TAVSLDVDLNNNGNFTGTGESNYAGSALHGGVAVFSIPSLPGTGTYPMRARVTDLAGNQGTSSTQTVQVTAVSNAWQGSAQVLTSDPVDGQSLEQLGNVQVQHALNLDQSPGTSQSGDPALVYNSDSVNVRPVVQASIAPPTNAPLPGSINVQLTWNGTLLSAPPALSTTGLHPGDVLTVAAQVDAAHAVTTSGAYSYSLHVWSTGFFDDTFSGYTFVDAQNSSPFGPGWTFSPVDQLVNITASGSIPAGQLRLYGTGGWRFYQDLGGGAFLSPPGDNGTLSKNLGTGVFTYYTPEGVQYLFNSSGQLTSRGHAAGQEGLS